jgi:hypothetical protein
MLREAFEKEAKEQKLDRKEDDLTRGWFFLLLRNEGTKERNKL